MIHVDIRDTKRALLEIGFGHFKWTRRLVRARWERWFVADPMSSWIWHLCEPYGDRDPESGKPCCLCRGLPEVEDYR